MRRINRRAPTGEQGAPNTQMGASQGEDTARRVARYCGIGSAVTFAVFAANVLLGKARITFDLDVPIPLGDVAEFLVFFASAFMFTMTALARERLRTRQEQRMREDAGHGAGNEPAGR